MATILIDADIVVYKAACANEQRVDWGANEYSDPEEETATTLVDAGRAVSDAKQSIERMANRLRCDSIVLCFSGGDNWRKRLYANYKANRASRQQPLLRHDLIRLLAKEYETVKIHGLEGDDALGLEQTRRNALGEVTVIASTDKDLRQIPGWHFNWVKDVKPVKVSLADGEYLHMLQTLTGDTCDGYKGCPGIGYGRAESVLPEDVTADPYDTWSRIVSLYEKAGLTESDAIANARQARILRTGEYDPKNRAIKLWLPFGGYEWYQL